jgi:hypothetical protein
MHTIVSHVTVATALGLHHARYVGPSAPVRLAAPSAGTLGLGLVLVIVAFLAVMAGAARGLVTLITEFLRVAASMTSVLLIMLIIIVLAVILLAHH